MKRARTVLAFARRILAAGFSLLASAWLSSSSTLGQESFAAKTGVFFEAHCLRCHGPDKQKGRFRLDDLKPEFGNPLVAEKWSEVAFRIKSSEMPPPDEPQPAPEEIGDIVEFLTLKVREGTAERMAHRGLVEHYRLSREEYAHTIYDLLGVVFDVEAPGTFNEDPRWHGINRVGALLSLAPSHIQCYFDAADTIVKLAFPEEQATHKTTRKNVGKGKRQLLQLGEGWNFNLEKPGRYRLRIRASGLPAFTGRVPHLSLWHTYHKRSYGGTDLVATEDAPTTIELEGLYPAGNYSIRNHARTIKHANGGISFFRNETIDANQSVASLTGKHRSPWTKVVDENGKPTTPLLLVDWVEIEGPLVTEAEQVKRHVVFPPETSSVIEKQTSLQRFAERAWRRPVAENEITPYAMLIKEEQESGESYRSAYKSAIASILVSRRFFNIEEGSPDVDRPEVNAFELASRLSFFLWSSMPDERLFKSAREGILDTRNGLATEFERMILDPKIERFLESFPKQWLQLHRVGMFQPDPKLYPEYDPWLEESMVQETTRYFAEMFRQNLPIREAIDSDWTILNARLALHYDLAQPTEPGFHKVHWQNRNERGGILTQASILSLTSDGTRHRPVHRGAWVSEAILAKTPTPPPPNVDPLEPVKGKQPKTTIRSKLEAHAIDPNCISCHAKIDPLGLAFENFDAIGRWRETEHVLGGTGEDPAVDASGLLPNGKAFNGAMEFKRLLGQDDEILAEAFLKHLATYALRRVMTIDDEQSLKLIVQSAKEDQLRLTHLVRQLVLSDLFRKR